MKITVKDMQRCDNEKEAEDTEANFINGQIRLLYRDGVVKNRLKMVMKRGTAEND